MQQKRPRLLWALSPVGPTLLGETRFWSKYETLVDIFLRYKLVVDSFVSKLLQAGIAPATVARIAKIIYDPDLERTFAKNMAAIVEYARPFVKATYFLEGDGFLSPFVYDTIMDLQMWCDTWGPEVAQHTTAVALHRCDDDAARAAVLVQAAVDKMQVGIDYFYWRFIQEGCVMEPTLRMYKACRFFDPFRVHLLRAREGAAEPIADLHHIPCIQNRPILHQRLIQEATIYRRLGQEVLDSLEPSDRKDYDRLQFFKKYESEIPGWAEGGPHFSIPHP